MGPDPSPVWDLAKQTGIEYGVFNLPGPQGDTRPWDLELLRQMKERAERAGIDIQVIEDRPPMDAIRLGRDGREEQITHVCELIENMGRLDIPVWCWVWRAHFPVVRTDEARLRGGSKGTAYNHSQLGSYLDGDYLAKSAPSISKESLWENLEYFLERVVPVAEDAGVKLALHPDDPPVDAGIGDTNRIITSTEAYDRVLDIYPSAHNGVCLGQGNFAAMGESIPDIIRRFDESVHFVHFRDVAGTAENFRETWHDNGQTDMLAAMEAYSDIGFDGPIRPDHFPEVTAGGLDGRSDTISVPDSAEQYEGRRFAIRETGSSREGLLGGRLFAIGYMRGLLEQVDDSG